MSNNPDDYKYSISQIPPEIREPSEEFLESVLRYAIELSEFEMLIRNKYSHIFTGWTMAKLSLDHNLYHTEQLLHRMRDSVAELTSLYNRYMFNECFDLRARAKALREKKKADYEAAEALALAAKAQAANCVA